MLQPDILFISKERLGMIGKANISGAPDSVVEILSPGSRHKDLAIKRKIYARFGVQEYWIVDPDAAIVEVLDVEGIGICHSWDLSRNRPPVFSASARSGSADLRNIPMKCSAE